MGVRGERARIVRRWLPIAVACLVVSLLPVSPVSAAEEPAGADEPASDALAAAETVPDDSAGGVEVARYAGSDQYELSLAVAQALVDADGGASEWVVLASGESWAEAATAGPLAASLGAPVVLVPPGGLQTFTARPDLVEFLRSSGVRRVVIAGSPEVLPNHEPSVLYGLGMLPRNIERIHRDDPIGTSIAVAERMGALAEFAELGRTVIIASDQSVTDAVAVGPLAAAGPFPLLLTASDALDPRITAYLAEREAAHVVLVGGTAAIAPAVQDAIETAGATVTRLAGEDRYHTAALAMDLLAGTPRCADDAIDSIGLTLGEEPQLALTAGSLLGPQCIPLLFTDADRLAPVTQNHLYLYRHRAGIEPDWHLIGGDVTIEPAAIEHPPVRMATVADNPGGHGQHIVVLDEHHQARRYLTDAGFDAITGVRWTPDRTAITFTASRDGALLVAVGFSDGDWSYRESFEARAQQSYELDLRSGEAHPQSRLPSRYASLIQEEWVDPMPSPDGEYLVFRSPTEGYAGHSLFALHVDTETITQLTHNTTNDTHHVVSSGWLADGRRLIYTHHDIAQLSSGCGNAPRRSAHVVDIASTQSRPLERGEVLMDDALVWSPDRRLLAIKSYEDFEFTPEYVDPWILQLWRCSHDGVGIPSVAVYDVSGAELRAVTETSASGFEPTWSPDSRFLVWRAPTEASAGHSLFALDAQTGEVAQITHNESDEYHHVAQRWLPAADRLLYTVQSVAEVKVSCGHSPSQMMPSGVPHIEAHLVHLESRGSARLEFDGFIVDGDWRIDISLDGSHVSFPTADGYVFWNRYGSCSYRSEDPRRLNVFDLTASEPRSVSVGAMYSTSWSWSPNGRYLAYDERRITDDVEPSFEEDHFVLDTETDSIWRVDAKSLFGVAVDLSAVEWSRDSEHLYYLAYDWSQRPELVVTPVIASVAAQELLPLELKSGRSTTLGSSAFSPDGSQLVQIASSGWFDTNASSIAGFPPNTAGLLYISDVASDGAVLGVYDLYAVTEPAEPVLVNPPESRHVTWYFRDHAEWTVAGIFATGYHYLYTSPFS